MGYKYTYGATVGFGLLLVISALLNMILVTILPKILVAMQVIGSLYMFYLAYQIFKTEHAHKEYAIGVTLRGIQHYNLDGSLQLSHQNGIMLFNLEQVLKLDELCKELRLSKFQFIRMFKAHTGISPYQYFLNSKIKHAKRLIEKNKHIYSAVDACGFVDLAHLNKHFKRAYGTTAFEYISHLQN